MRRGAAAGRRVTVAILFTVLGTRTRTITAWSAPLVTTDGTATVVTGAPGGAATRSTASTRSAGSGPRKDVQALRAVAVAIVVLYHFWPARLTGGYVGVDVFFVISGYLITTHLLHRPIDGTRALLEFWARRVRRLIPAATLVLVVTLAASLVWLPQTVLARISQEVIASAVYAENWLLALTSTDYLATDQLHSPTQHYWSLSVEEQFYIVWPVLLGVAFLVSRRLGRAFRFPPLAVVGTITLASLGFSAWFTGEDPAQAYFVSTTRVWELGVGATLAAALHAGLRLRSNGVRLALVWGGLAGILWSAWTFTAATPFPGVAALVPTLGTAAVIAASSDGLRGGPYPLWSWRPVQWLGDVSYSVYLWHWPAVVIAPFALGTDRVTWVHKLVIIAGVLVVSALSKRWVEDLMRFTPRIARSTRRSFVLLAACLAVSIGFGGISLWQVNRSTAQAQAVVIDSSAPCVGADYLRTASCAGRQVELLTEPVRAADDKPEVYADDCWNNRPFTRRKVCSYGPADATTTVALYGNSHAGQWAPPILAEAKAKGWRVDTYIASECYSVDVTVSFSTTALQDNCSAFNRWARDRITKGRYDLVVMSDRTLQPLAGVSAARKTAVAQASYSRVMKTFTAAGSAVLVIRDTPGAAQSVPDCVARYREDLGRCATSTTFTGTSGLEPDPLSDAAEAMAGGMVSRLDVTDLLCRDGSCPAVLGGLITYFDHGHMTRTFSLTLLPEVSRAMTAALAARTGS